MGPRPGPRVIILNRAAPGPSISSTASKIQASHVTGVENETKGFDFVGRKKRNIITNEFSLGEFSFSKFVRLRFFRWRKYLERSNRTNEFISYEDSRIFDFEKSESKYDMIFLNDIVR